ncbi:MULTISPECIES: hypothetical protein [unclassified Arcicella]|uniref:hypothetical protein n=1 Tax=unclassified Arcicella TaxID=2644986 RepID=UPI0028612077|nr:MULTISPECIES: hypothetical protein [unclassified Arcicella]MDR6560595.1 hypothetical protein [Arcicella sp. BE51]MDR6814678.1 hypothetical protein [Arcicella sp. BE140]MDR6826124.1 hypothetical protein [Arcicella sp. BE139]
MKSIFKLFFLGCLIQLLPNLSFGQVSVSVRYGQGFVNKEILPSFGSFREKAIARNDLAFGIQVPIVKKWRLYIQAEMEIQTKEYQKQFISQDNIQLPNGEVEYQPVYEDVFYKVNYSSNQFPVLIKKGFNLTNHLSISLTSGVLLGYSYKGVNTDKLYYNGQETTSNIITANRFYLSYSSIKGSANDELKYYSKDISKTEFVFGGGVFYELFNFKLGAEYRYTPSNNILPQHSHPYHSANISLAYNLFNKNETKK